MTPQPDPLALAREALEEIKQYNERLPDVLRLPALFMFKLNEALAALKAEQREGLMILTDEWVRSLLRESGCKCERPLLGFRPGVGPRCRLCNVQAGEQREVWKQRAEWLSRAGDGESAANYWAKIDAQIAANSGTSESPPPPAQEK